MACGLPGLALEFGATRLPGAGFANCGFLCFFALAIPGGPGPALAALGVTLATLLRGLVHGHPLRSLRLLENLTALVPILAALAVLPVLSNPVYRIGGGLFVYLVLAQFLPDLLSAELPEAMRARLRTMQSRLTLTYFACAFGALALAAAGRTHPLCGLLFWPFLLHLRRSLDQVVALEEQSQRHDVIQELKQSKDRLQQATLTEDKLRQVLHRQAEEYRTLEAATRTLLQAADLNQTADSILSLCRSLVRCTSCVLFARDAQGLVPFRFSAPHQERLMGARLAGMHEAMVVAAYESQMAQFAPVGPREARIFPDEPHAVAIPLTNFGVLYVGRVRPELSEVEIRYLNQAASQSSLGLQIASHLQALRTALEQQRSITTELNQWTQSVDGLLRQAMSFLDALELDRLKEQVLAATAALFPHDSLEVVMEPTHPLEACQAVLVNRTPLLLDDVAGSRFAPHRSGQRSLLCVPMFHARLHKTGCIILGANEPHAYTRLHRDLLSLLGFLAAVAWKNSELYSETVAAQSQLVQSSKLAAVGQLAAGMAHEINTPLGSVGLNVDMARRLLDKDPKQAGSRLEKATEMVSRTQAIVEKLLYYSRQAQAGRRPTDVNRLLQDTVDLMQHPLSLEGVTVELRTLPVGLTLVNQNEIQQVLFNLLLNARDAVAGLSPERRVVRITSEQLRERVLVRVRDDGRGIPEADMEHIFDPFFTTKEVGKGTGLGLSVSQQIMSGHDGTLQCTSEPGVGTEFTVSLPLAPTDAKEPV